MCLNFNWKRMKRQRKNKRQQNRERNEIENRNLFITKVTFVWFLSFTSSLTLSCAFSLFLRFGFVIAYCFCERRCGSACTLILLSMATAFRCCLHTDILFCTIVVVVGITAFSLKKKCLQRNVDVVRVSKLKRHINCIWCMWRHLNDTYKTRNGERQFDRWGEKEKEITASEKLKCFTYFSGHAAKMKRMTMREVMCGA